MVYRAAGQNVHPSDSPPSVSLEVFRMEIRKKGGGYSPAVQAWFFLQFSNNPALWLLLVVINFAAAMRKIATILLVIFALVQAGPVCCSLLTETKAIFIADEEKTPEKTDAEKKVEKKDFLAFCNMDFGYSQYVNTTFLPVIPLRYHTYLEMHTPPPDFC